MKTRMLAATLALAALPFTASVALAQQAQFWQVTQRAPNVYGANSDNSNNFMPPTGIPTSANITHVSWVVSSYTHGWSQQEVKLCYFLPYSGTALKCHDISTELTGDSTEFNFQPARGSFRVTFRHRAGAYPVYPPATQTNTVRVDY
jgi:hypothetical protein